MMLVVVAMCEHKSAGHQDDDAEAECRNAKNGTAAHFVTRQINECKRDGGRAAGDADLLQLLRWPRGDQRASGDAC